MLEILKLNTQSILFIGLICFSIQAKAAVTPSDVHHKVGIINAEIQLIRDELGVKKKAQVPALQMHKSPVHVYFKALELHEKISKLQKKHGLKPSPTPKLLIANITPEEVLSSMDKILIEVFRVKQKLGITKDIGDIAYYPGRTPSNVYEHLWMASYLVDAMIKSIKSTDVFESTLYVQNELSLIASHLNVTLPNEVKKIQSGKTPKQVNLQGYINLHKISLLEKKMDMTAFRVAAYPKIKITPADVYDTTNMMLAEISRMKVHLGIDKATQKEYVKDKKRPSQVLVQMDLINDQLDYLASISY